MSRIYFAPMRRSATPSDHMADDDDENATATASKAVTFRINHLVRLRGFNHLALDGKLVRIDSNVTLLARNWTRRQRRGSDKR
jgi:hypothetical protein